MATISSLLRDHVRLQVRSVDRLFLQAYVPKLMSQHQLVRFMLDRGFTIPPAPLAKQGRAYVAAIERFAAANGVAMMRFVKGASKEDTVRPYLQAAERERRVGVVLIGVAQEKTSAWRGWRHGGRDEHPHFEFGRPTVFVNHYYLYILDPDWGPAFIKSCAYAPFAVRVYPNGHEWAKRQATRDGLGCEELDNGFRSAKDAAALAGDLRAPLSPRSVALL